MTATLPTKTTLGDMYFKPVDGNFLFETPHPWLFAPGRRYLVSARQKEELLAIINPRRPILRIILISSAIIAYACIVSLLWWGIGQRSTPSLLDLVGMAVTILVPLYAATLVGIRRYLRRIAPIVSAAVPTKMSMTVGERYQNTGDAMPKPLLVILLIIGPLAFVANMLSIATNPAPVQLSATSFLMPVLQSVMPLLFAGFAAYALNRRRRRSK